MSTETVAKTTEQATEQRVITIVTTRGQKIKLGFEGSEWAALKSKLEAGGTDINGNRYDRYDLSNIKCVESVNRTTLEHPKAIVPDGNFNLFLMPYKSKSGSFNRIDCYSKIKKFISKEGDKAVAHFNAGKNYTNKSTEELNNLIESFKPGYTKETKKRKAEATVDVATSFLEADNVEDAFAQLEGLTTDQKLDIIIKALFEIRNSSPKATAAITSYPPKKTQEEIEAEEKEKKDKEEKDRADKEAKERDRKETEELQQSMEELMGGFPDVKRR